MKKFFKIASCLMLSALTLVSACACKGGVSDLRRRERSLKEQLPVPQQKQILQDDELDPDFLVDPESDDVSGDSSSEGEQNSGCPDCPKEPDCPDCPKEPDCPDCPKQPREHHKAPPRHGRRPHCGGRKHTTTLPYPVPDDEGGN